MYLCGRHVYMQLLLCLHSRMNHVLAPTPIVSCSREADNIGGKQEQSKSTAMRGTTSSASSYACTVTPPMTLPSRGWGDRDSGSEGCGIRHFSGFSCHPSSAGGGDTGSTTESCSSGSSCGRGSTGGGLRGGAGLDCDGRELKQFHLSDGFSSAEEETWGSEGEVRERERERERD